jgi:hypothetical protein
MSGRPAQSRADGVLFVLQEGTMEDPESRFRGDKLDELLIEYGLYRYRGEPDWDFRRRVFPTLYLDDGTRELSFEVLCGTVASSFSEDDRAIRAEIRANCERRYALERRMNEMTADPVIRRRTVR